MNPKKPECPNCGKRLRKCHHIGTNDYPERDAKVKIYICSCGAATGIFVRNNPIPNEQYTVKKVK